MCNGRTNAFSRTTFYWELRLIENDNSSYGFKMNLGIEESRGNYIAFLESDDLMKPGMMSTLFDIAQRDNLDFIKCSCTNFISHKGGRFEIDQDRFLGMRQTGEIIDLTVSDTDRLLFLNNIWSGLYKRSFLVKNHIFFNESPGASYQDTGFSFLCIMYGKRVRAIEDCLYLYRRNREGSSVRDLNKYRCIYDEVEWIYDQIKNRNLDDTRNMFFLKQVRENVFLWNLIRIGEDGREKFFRLLEDRSDFERLLEDRVYNNSMSDAQFLRVKDILQKGESISLFGAGRIGKAVLQLQKYLGKEAVCRIIDNDWLIVRMCGLIFNQIVAQSLISPVVAAV